MFWRITIVVLLVVLAIGVLAWPVSYLGIAYNERQGGYAQSVELRHGVLSFHSEPIESPRPLDRDVYTIGTGGSTSAKSRWFPQAQRKAAAIVPGDIVDVSIPLSWIVVPPAGVLFVVGVRAFTRTRRRRANGQCLHCGYKRTSDEGPCTECGMLPEEARAQRGVVSARTFGDAGLVLFAALFALSVSFWYVDRLSRRAIAAHAARAFDYSWYLETCQPRLTGEVLIAAPGNGADSISAVMRRAMPGAVIVLLPGKHELGNVSSRNPVTVPSDVRIIGAGRDTTTLSLILGDATRVQIEGVTIDCQNNEAVNFRQGGSIVLKDCRLMNYNSGAGGSNAIFAVESALLVESCEFEGRSGRAAEQPRMRGDAMDLRGSNRVFVRDTKFTNNGEVYRSGEGVFDHCEITGEDDNPFWAPAGAYVRNPKFGTMARYQTAPTVFTESFDDLAFLQRLSGQSGGATGPAPDPVAAKLAEALHLDSDPRFWTRLLFHPGAEVRGFAAQHLGVKPAPASSLSLEQAMKIVGDPEKPLSSEVVLAVLAGGEPAKGALEAMKVSDPANVSGPAAAIGRRAEGLLQLIDASLPLRDLVHYERYRAPR